VPRLRFLPDPVAGPDGLPTLRVGDARRLLQPAATGRLSVCRALDPRIHNWRAAALALDALAGRRASEPASRLSAAVALAVGWGTIFGCPELADLQGRARELVGAAVDRVRARR
jgi:hypothetical protein